MRTDTHSASFQLRNSPLSGSADVLNAELTLPDAGSPVYLLSITNLGSHIEGSPFTMVVEQSLYCVALRQLYLAALGRERWPVTLI